MLIHREGKKTLLFTFIALGAVNLVLFYFFYKCILTYTIFIISVVLFLVMMNFFKKPKRIYTGQLLGSVNAPTDGKVVVIEKVFEKDFLQTECIQISIFMTLFNAHSNWMPVTGKVIHVSHQAGRFLAAYLPKSSHENERSNIVIETPDGHKILTRQIAGAMARRIVTYIHEGESYCIGDPLGFIKLGSRMDIFVPADSEILVQLGEEVRANKTFLAHFCTNKQATKE